MSAVGGCGHRHPAPLEAHRSEFVAVTAKGGAHGGGEGRGGLPQPALQKTGSERFGTIRAESTAQGSSAGAAEGGHAMRVQAAMLLTPLAGQTQVLQLSSAWKGAPGRQRSCVASDATSQASAVHMASATLPLFGQAQTLQPSAPSIGAPGTHRPGDCCNLEVCFSCEQTAPLVTPLGGQTHGFPESWS